MSESSVKASNAIDGRELFGSVKKRAGKIRDRFNRAVVEGDAILSPAMTAAGLPLIVQQIVPATEKGIPPGAFWVDVACRSRILVQGGVPNDDVLLLMPHVPAETLPSAEGNEGLTPPAAAKTASGIILSDPDGMRER